MDVLFWRLKIKECSKFWGNNRGNCWKIDIVWNLYNVEVLFFFN